MTTSSTSHDRNPVEALADEFLARQRAGERPTLEDYCRRHPELAGIGFHGVTEAIDTTRAYKSARMGRPSLAQNPHRIATIKPLVSPCPRWPGWAWPISILA